MTDWALISERFLNMRLLTFIFKPIDCAGLHRRHGSPSLVLRIWRLVVNPSRAPWVAVNYTGTTIYGGAGYEPAVFVLNLSAPEMITHLA